MAESFRTPTHLERTFLRLVTRCYPDLAAQIELCEIADYDETGWCNVRVLGGPPCALDVKEPIDGPTLLPADDRRPLIDLLMWLDDARRLSTIEVVVYDDSNPDVYQLFVDAIETRELQYFSHILQRPAPRLNFWIRARMRARAIIDALTHNAWATSRHKLH